MSKLFVRRTQNRTQIRDVIKMSNFLAITPEFSGRSRKIFFWLHNFPSYITMLSFMQIGEANKKLAHTLHVLDTLLRCGKVHVLSIIAVPEMITEL